MIRASLWPADVAPHPVNRHTGAVIREPAPRHFAAAIRAAPAGAYADIMATCPPHLVDLVDDHLRAWRVS